MHFMPLSFSMSVCVAKAFLGFLRVANTAAGYIQQQQRALALFEMSLSSSRENEKASAVWRVLRNTHTQKYIILSLCGCFYFKRARWQKRNSSLSSIFLILRHEKNMHE
jgi:hypothetical protein